MTPEQVFGKLNKYIKGITATDFNVAIPSGDSNAKLTDKRST